MREGSWAVVFIYFFHFSFFCGFVFAVFKCSHFFFQVWMYFDHGLFHPEVADIWGLQPGGCMIIKILPLYGFLVGKCSTSASKSCIGQKLGACTSLGLLRWCALSEARIQLLYMVCWAYFQWSWSDSWRRVIERRSLSRRPLWNTSWVVHSWPAWLVIDDLFSKG